MPEKKLSVFHDTQMLITVFFYIVHFPCNYIIFTKGINQPFAQYSFYLLLDIQRFSARYLGHLQRVMCSDVPTQNYLMWLQLLLCLQLLKLLKSICS
jgi:hypothetical protein